MCTFFRWWLAATVAHWQKWKLPKRNTTASSESTATSTARSGWLSTTARRAIRSSNCCQETLRKFSPRNWRANRTCSPKRTGCAYARSERASFATAASSAWCCVRTNWRRMRDHGSAARHFRPLRCSHLDTEDTTPRSDEKRKKWKRSDPEEKSHLIFNAFDQSFWNISFQSVVVRRDFSLLTTF